MDLPTGVRSFFSDYWKLHRRAYESSDFDALNVIIDAKKAIDGARLTQKQRSALHKVFIEGMTQEQAAEVLGITQPSLNERIDTAINRIAEGQGYDEQAFKEWAGAYYGREKVTT